MCTCLKNIINIHTQNYIIKGSLDEFVENAENTWNQPPPHLRERLTYVNGWKLDNADYKLKVYMKRCNLSIHL